MDGELERKLCELVDRQEIWDLLLRFGRGLDRLDIDLVRSIYWDDAIEDHHAFIGTPDDFIAWANGHSQKTSRVQHHVMTNHFCELDGDDAHSETYFTFISENFTPPHQLAIGRYVDHFQRRGGIWKIANRVTMIESNIDLETAMDPAVLAAPEMTAGKPTLPSTRDRRDFSYLKPIKPRRPA